MKNTNFAKRICIPCEIEDITSLRAPDLQVETFPDSNCLICATFFKCTETNLRIVTIYVRSYIYPTKVTQYKYGGYTSQIEDDFQALLDARDNSKSAGKLYHNLFTPIVYPSKKSLIKPKTK
jgi:hypothetical protein